MSRRRASGGGTNLGRLLMASGLDALCRDELEGCEGAAVLYDVGGWPRDGVDGRNQARLNGGLACPCPRRHSDSEGLMWFLLL